MKKYILFMEVPQKLTYSNSIEIPIKIDSSKLLSYKYAC